MLIAVRKDSQTRNSADNLEGNIVRIAILTRLSQAVHQYLSGGIDG